MNKVYRILSIMLIALLFSGCANYVTDKNLIDKANNSIASATKYFDLTIEFAAPPALLQGNKYYVVFFTTENAKIHYIKEDWTPEAYFITPIDSAEMYNKQKVRDAYLLPDDDLTPLYETYFQSWQSIYTYDATSRLQYYPGPYLTTANQGIPPTPLSASYILPSAANELHFKLPIPADDFRFQVFAVNGSKVLKDNLDDHYQVQYVNNSGSSSLPQQSGAGDGLDIKKFTWRTYEN